MHFGNFPFAPNIVILYHMCLNPWEFYGLYSCFTNSIPPSNSVHLIYQAILQVSTCFTQPLPKSLWPPCAGPPPPTHHPQPDSQLILTTTQGCPSARSIRAPAWPWSRLGWKKLSWLSSPHKNFLLQAVDFLPSLCLISYPSIAKPGATLHFLLTACLSASHAKTVACGLDLHSGQTYQPSIFRFMWHPHSPASCLAAAALLSCAICIAACTFCIGSASC